jgi:bifunctional ADP-heptose synthase (sugar kinase/adenylyltransferase)
MELRCVDKVCIFDDPTPLELIRVLKPDIIVKGGDWKEKDVVGRELVSKVVIIPRIDNLSTTDILRRGRK